MKILIVGAGGMLGHVLYTELQKKHEVIGTVRKEKWNPDLLSDYDIEYTQKYDQLIENFRPDFVINCVGIIKQRQESTDRILAIKTNSLWPHQLAKICEKHQAKVIHFSTDCVFSGKQGNYQVEDLADARDTYGLTKYMGEIDYPHTLTLRTSIIGHELNSNISLVDWFLSQKQNCKGYINAIYSGFPTVYVAEFLDNFIFKSFICGIYHFSSNPINKFELLKLIADQYDKKIPILPDEELKIDRSLNSDHLRELLNFKPPTWKELIKQMNEQFRDSKLYINK
jgi:dTDP-4-dehydrorhamnose reductase